MTADIVRKRSGRLDFLGRSSAETNEAGAVFGELVTPCVNESKPSMFESEFRVNVVFVPVFFSACLLSPSVFLDCECFRRRGRRHNHDVDRGRPGEVARRRRGLRPRGDRERPRLLERPLLEQQAHPLYRTENLGLKEEKLRFDACLPIK